jgi:hypothetical protein
MTKTTRALSGAAKNAFLDGVVRSALGDDHAARERLMQDLVAAITALRVRVETERAGDADLACEPAAEMVLPPVAEPVQPAAQPDAAFDPYSPNVVVVLRKQGREAAIAALLAIGGEDRLRRLSGAQQLGLPEPGLSVAQLCEAIVEAAERRVANRRAAAS